MEHMVHRSTIHPLLRADGILLRTEYGLVRSKYIGNGANIIKTIKNRDAPVSGVDAIGMRRNLRYSLFSGMDDRFDTDAINELEHCKATACDDRSNIRKMKRIVQNKMRDDKKYGYSDKILNMTDDDRITMQTALTKSNNDRPGMRIRKMAKRMMNHKLKNGKANKKGKGT